MNRFEFEEALRAAAPHFVWNFASDGEFSDDLVMARHRDDPADAKPFFSPVTAVIHHRHGERIAVGDGHDAVERLQLGGELHAALENEWSNTGEVNRANRARLLEIVGLPAEPPRRGDPAAPPGTVFRIRAAGPIRDAELELGRLTVIAGPNRSGKSSVLRSLHAALWNWHGSSRIVTAAERGGFPVADAFPSRLRVTEADPGAATINLAPPEVTAIRNAVLETLAKTSRPAHPTGPAITGHLPDPDEAVYAVANGTCTVTIRQAGNTFTISVEYHRNSADRHRDPFGAGARNVRLALLRFIVRDLLPEPVQIPRDRHELRYSHQEIDRPRQRPSALWTPQVRKTMRALLGGTLRQTTAALWIHAPRQHCVQLELSAVSARRLAILAAYLQHRANRNHLLLLNQPEAHLDATGQIALARLLVEIAEAGLRTVVATHSDFLVKELNNLVMLAGIPPGTNDRDLRKIRKAYARQTLPIPGAIRGYVAGDGTLTACDQNRFGLDMPHMDEAIDRINGTANLLGSYLD